jgi:hypothetical protein
MIIVNIVFEGRDKMVIAESDDGFASCEEDEEKKEELKKTE